MVRDVALRGLEKGKHRYYGKKEQPDPLGVDIGLRTPKKGVEFFHRKRRGSYGDLQMQSLKILKTGVAGKRKRHPFTQAAFFV
jgi:hypothetical protein